MNRIILIGNGFDLAHGLRTKYENFLDDYWRKKSDKIAKESSFEYEDNDIRIQITRGKSLSEYWSPSSDLIHSYYDFKEHMYKVQESMDRGYRIYPWNYFTYYNKFLEKITDKHSLVNWVDIEEEYYKLLQEIIDKNIPNNKKTYTDIEWLNSDFSRIKKDLVSYLLEETTKEIRDGAIEFVDSTINENIYSEFELRDFTKEGVNGLVDEKYQDYLVECRFGIRIPLRDEWQQSKNLSSLASYPTDKDYFDRNIRNGEEKLMPLRNILFLNFNYTKTESKYNEYEDVETQTIHIHGELNNPNNPVIFGYGDEIGKEYEEIKNLNDNNFFENIKSKRYSDTSNYKRLMDYIDSDKYQIFLFGHSCGLSDRTLLNKLFEHENCVSIKPFYHIKKDGTDNYHDIVRNISRHFGDEAMMRKKVVNKEYCRPLSKNTNLYK